MSDPVKVLVLYDHPLLGEGLSALMGSVADLAVERVAMRDPDAMERALAYDADVVVLEEGGPVGLVDLLRQSRARAIVDVSMTTSKAFAIRREEISTDPESLIDRIVGACLGGRPSPDRSSDRRDDRDSPGTAVGPGSTQRMVPAPAVG